MSVCLSMGVSECAFVCTHVPESRWGDGPGSAPGLTRSRSCPTLCRALSRVTITASDLGLALLATCTGQSWPRGFPGLPMYMLIVSNPHAGVTKAGPSHLLECVADAGAHLLLPPFYAHSPLSYFLLYSLLPISFPSFLPISEF